MSNERTQCCCGCRFVADDYGKLQEPYRSSTWFRALYDVITFEDLTGCPAPE